MKLSKTVVALSFALIAVVIGMSGATRTFPTHFHTTMVNEVVPEVNAHKSTWEAWPSYRFRNSTLANVATLCGALPVPESVKATYPVKRVEADMEIPESFDSRTAFKGCESTISLIRDQSSCGSCWAVSSAKVFTARRCIATQGKLTEELSGYDLMSCCSSCGNGCGGGYPFAAMSSFVETGVVTGGEWNSKKGCLPYPLETCDHHESGPYKPCPPEGGTPSCKTQCEASYGTPYLQDKKKATHAYQVPSDVESIQKEIMTNGPVAAAFTVYSDFPTYRSGVYRHTCGSILGGHAVTIIGWDKDSWLVENSWNDSWGNKGLFNIVKGNDECGIESSIVAVAP
jgi:cathepsin B